MLLEPNQESLAIRAFTRAIERKGSRVLEQAWARLTQGGLPLVERLREDREGRLVTFVWRPGSRASKPSVYLPVSEVLLGDDGLRQAGSSGVWFRSVQLSRRTRMTYAFSPLPVPDLRTPPKTWVQYLKSLVPDPANPRTFDFEKDPDDPDDFALRFSLLELPGAPRQPWSTPKGPLRGSVEHHRLKSRFLRTARSVWVYLPPAYNPRSHRYDLVIAFDGVLYRNVVPTPTIVQNLTSVGKIRPSVVVLIGSAPGARERELAHNPAFADFLGRELVPWLRRRYRLRVDPSRTVVAGSSLGGLMAAFAAFRYPRLFGNVLAQSGAFQFSASGFEGSPTVMDEYANAPRLPVRFYLDAGNLERTNFPPQAVSILGSVRHLRDVLRAKGYDVTYREFEGGHDYVCWAGTMADGLIDLLGSSRRRGPSRKPRPRPT